jgi:putative flippase GtrA
MVSAFLTSERLAELVRYGIATALSATVTLGVPVALHEGLDVSERHAVGIAFAAAFALNFITTRSFVFRSTGKARNDLPRYVLTSLAFRLAEYGAFLLLFQMGLLYYVAQFIVVSLSLVIKFLTFKTFVYGRRRQPT